MLIRPVEFQDSFTRVPVQGARQLSLDLNRPDIQQRQMAQVAVEQSVQDQSRPMASEQPEDGGIDPNGHPLPEHPRRGRRRLQQETPEAEEPHPPHVSTTGTHVDFVA